MVQIWYASMTEVQRAADVPSSAHFDAHFADVMDQATDAVHQITQRSFAPMLDTRYFPWPQDMSQNPRMLRLGKDELVSVTAAVGGDGNNVSLSNLKLINEDSADDGGPYNCLMNSGGWVGSGTFPERSIGITGVYCGGPLVEQNTADTVSSLSGSTVDISDSSRVEVGSVIRIADERLVVSRRGWLQSNNAASITIDDEETSDMFAVTSGAAFHVNEWILIDSEQMLITDIVGNNLIVLRAYNGSQLAQHTGVTAVYVNRRLTVERGALGTTAVDTGSGADVLLFKFPPLVRQLCKAEALTIMQQDAASYASRSGSGQGEIPMAVRALPDLRERVKGLYGRMRSGAV